jgi:hypothetical protein
MLVYPGLTLIDHGHFQYLFQVKIKKLLNNEYMYMYRSFAMTTLHQAIKCGSLASIITHFTMYTDDTDSVDCIQV